MEEGKPPPTDDNIPSSSTATATTSHACPSPLTYIVQVPKDQIFRIPPEENGRLAEQYHAHHASLRKNPSPCLHFLLRFLCVSIFIALPLLAAALVFVIVVRPAAPVFDVDRIAANQSNDQVDILMAVANPSAGMGCSIHKSVGRAARLRWNGENVAYGESPLLQLNPRESRRFRLVLRGARKKKKGLNEAGEVGLMVEAKVRAEIWGVWMWWMKMKVECEARVGKGKATKVLLLSQACKVSIRFW